jgi:D-xylonolactonase
MAKHTRPPTPPPPPCLQAFDYDPATGALANGRVAFPTKFENPDGCTMDAEGRLWVAHWGASLVAAYNVGTGAVEVVVRVPSASRVSSCAFGGPALADLLITTAWEGMVDDAAARAAAGEGNAGNVFLVRGAGKGLPPCDYRG